MRELLRRIHYLLHRRRLDAELQSDMDFHREMAARAGRRNFGNELRLREQSREAWGWTWLERLLQDIRYGTRILVRSPGFTVLAVLVLAMGIGVNVSAFSFFNLMALKPLPVRDPASLVRLERRSPHAYTDSMPYPSFLFYRDNSKTLSAAIAVLGVPPMQFEDDLEPTSVSFVTPNYFTELGAHTAYGRLFSPAADGNPGAAPAVVLSYGFWQSRLNSDPSVIGTIIHVNRKPLTIAGVLPYDFASLGGQHPAIWAPILQQPYLVDGSKALTDPSDSTVRMWGRLAPGVTPKAAEQELLSLTNELRRRHPAAIWEGEFIQSSPGGHLQVLQPNMLKVVAMIAVLTFLILAVSCANLGGLLLARAVSRTHEIGIRFAIGASRGRIFRQLCTESLLLALLGSTAGLILSCIVLRVALRLSDAPGWISTVPDLRVLAFTAAMTVLAALFFGLAPALQIARQRHNRTIARQVLLAAQVAASCVLLIVAGLLVRAAQHALFTDPGFGYEHALTIDPQLGRHGYTPSAAKSYLDRLQDRLRSTPGVRSVGLVKLPPMGHIVSNQSIEIHGHAVTLYPNWVDAQFFDTMQIPILMGRTFRPGEKNVVIISESVARREWSGQNPIGQQVGNGNATDTIIGVAGNARVNALSDSDAVEQYWPVQPDDMPDMVVVVRSAGSPDALPPIAQSISESLDPRIFPEIRRLQLLFRNNVQGIERIAAAVALVGLVAVLLAGIGILGLVAFAVTQRTKEIAIRLALGAARIQVLTAIVRQFLWPVASGLVVGIGLAVTASRFLRQALYGISNLDPIGYCVAVAVLLALIAVATLLPARRALRLDVARALHHD